MVIIINGYRTETFVGINLYHTWIKVSKPFCDIPEWYEKNYGFLNHAILGTAVVWFTKHFYHITVGLP